MTHLCSFKSSRSGETISNDFLIDFNAAGRVYCRVQELLYAHNRGSTALDALPPQPVHLSGIALVMHISLAVTTMNKIKEDFGSSHGVRMYLTRKIMISLQNRIGTHIKSMLH